MKRVNSGLYTENKSVVINGQLADAEFRIFRIKSKDPKNPSKTKMLPLWSYDCPSLKILARDVYNQKRDAIVSLKHSCEIGFKTIQVNSVMLAIDPV